MTNDQYALDAVREEKYVKPVNVMANHLLMNREPSGNQGPFQS
jgi:hypothetical protein